MGKIIRKGTGEEYILDKEIITIGRGTDCDILINGDKDISTVSRKHAIILTTGRMSFIKDMSKFGTSIMSQGRLVRLPQKREVELKTGDIIILANIELHFE